VYAGPTDRSVGLSSLIGVPHVPAPVPGRWAGPWTGRHLRRPNQEYGNLEDAWRPARPGWNPAWIAPKTR